ncbi:MAG: hypothetical protein AAF471_04385, partial [Myxococcota bacterium]
QEYERYLESLRDRASFYDSTYGDGHREGREEGQREKTLEIARNLLKSGMDSEAIAAATGLTRGEIESL